MAYVYGCVSLLRSSVGLPLILALAGCTGELPLYDLAYAPRGQADVTPVGPKVAALMANLKCELYEAVNNKTTLEYYQNDPLLHSHDESLGKDPIEQQRLEEMRVANKRNFSMQNIFQEIEYVGEVQLQLDVTSTEALNPSANFISLYHAAPSTSLTLAVGAQLSEAGHRYIYQYVSVDFERLVDAEIDSPSADRTAADFRRLGIAAPPGPCANGPQLSGRLGIAENLAASLTADAMNDISVWPSDALPKEAPVKINSAAAEGKYTFGQMTMDTDFTITSMLNGGPNWTLAEFKGPAAGSNSSFASVTRKVMDQATITFIPICIRNAYGLVYPKGKTFDALRSDIKEAARKSIAQEVGKDLSGKPRKIESIEVDTLPANWLGDLKIVYSYDDNGVKMTKPLSKSSIDKLPLEEMAEKYPPYQYRRHVGGINTPGQEMVVGTPGWANYLPPCGPADKSIKASALARANDTNSKAIANHVILVQ